MPNHLRPRNRVFCCYMYTNAVFDFHCMFLYCFCFFLLRFAFGQNCSKFICVCNVYGEGLRFAHPKIQMDFNDGDGALCWLFHVLLPALLCIYDDFNFISRSTLYTHYINCVCLGACIFLFLTYSAFATDSPNFLINKSFVWHSQLWNCAKQSLARSDIVGWFSFVRIV